MDCDKIQELWIKWADDELGAEDREVLDRHLEQCDRCRNEFENYKGAIRGVSELESKPLGPEFAAGVVDAHLARRGRVINARARFNSRGRWWTTAVAAAALIMGLLLGRFVFQPKAAEVSPTPVLTVQNIEPVSVVQEPISVAFDSSNLYVQAVDALLDQHQLDEWNAQWMETIDDENLF